MVNMENTFLKQQSPQHSSILVHDTKVNFSNSEVKKLNLLTTDNVIIAITTTHHALFFITRDTQTSRVQRQITTLMGDRSVRG